ncbi:unnamed protein product [Adineta steineri]|uniref:Uncharacterized protein n=1 Tax=Adineta steineri TaxID=433720 RepID=A0A814VQ53_9BILA|nr:unnamed protein product [Adineta steineri]CAF1191970.1 unnamed protein product [Adineta steineri]
MNYSKALALIIFLNLIFCVSFSDGGIIGALCASVGGYGLCQTACNAGWVSCYAAAGLVAGVSTGGQ